MSIKNLSNLINAEYFMKYFTNQPDERPNEDVLFIDSSKIETFIDKKIELKYYKNCLDAISNIIDRESDYDEIEFKGIDGKFFKLKCDDNYDSDLVIFGYVKYSNGCTGDNECAYIFSSKYKNKPIFIILGNIGSHPCIITNTFVYDNSDGSGPGSFRIKDDDIKKVTADLIIHKIYTYFTLFCDDSFH
jgi:hypothetical protein